LRQVLKTRLLQRCNYSGS